MRDSDTWFSPSSLLCNEDRAWLKDEAKTCVDLDPCFVQENGDEYFDTWLRERVLVLHPRATRAIFGFKYHTAYLSITYFDRFFSKRVVHDGHPVWHRTALYSSLQHLPWRTSLFTGSAESTLSIYQSIQLLQI
ncbi:hypothetical protein CJ030_MR5G024536 [Morella rubra]|uniref:Uncharacterized protein n=1 Tax=Morella rubra TaxID=262757 RepID=A0A6A1VS84_9ROSI|nr:hypothetical protein CJ030_MR5G024536 [Morella rubra]